MRKLALVIACVLLATMPAMAQEYPRVEIFVGPSLISKGDGGREHDLGWHMNLAGNFHKNVGIAADLSGQYGSEFGFSIQTYEYLAGPRLTGRSEKVTGFGYALIGGVTEAAQGSGSASGFAMAFGGGLDVNVSDRIAVRPVQLDWLPVHLEGVWFTTNFRVATGVVIKLGGS